jgi:hypothetical protein
LTLTRRSCAREPEKDWTGIEKLVRNRESRNGNDWLRGRFLIYVTWRAGLQRVLNPVAPVSRTDESSGGRRRAVPKVCGLMPACTVLLVLYGVATSRL